MINGFENETAALSAEEIEVAKDVEIILSFATGKECAMTSTEIQKSIHWARLDGPRLRKIINYIRLRGTIKNLLATSKGYYCSCDPEEIESYRQSLQQRASAILAVRDSFVITPEMQRMAA